MMYHSNYIYTHNSEELHGYLAYEDEENHKRPAVLVVHDWSGRGEFACQKAELLAHMGYLGFAVDMYGKGTLGNTTEEKKALMQPLMQDRQLLVSRLKSAYDVVAGMSEVDNQRIAVIGFCFGGLCALDLVRSGLDIKGAASFHGLLFRPETLPIRPIKAKILALHGYQDPMVPPEQLHSFCQEMTEAQADWQVHMYGQAHHAFTNPDAHDEQAGLLYNSLAAKRSWELMSQFLNELFKRS